MRSSRSASDPLDPLARCGIRPSRASSRAGYCREHADGLRRRARNRGRYRIDLLLTVDGRPLVFHDRRREPPVRKPPDDWRSNRPDQLAALEVGGRASRLTDLLALVDGRVPLLLECQGRPGISGAMPRDALAARAQAGYSGPVGVMSFDAGLMRWLKTNAPELRRGLVIAIASRRPALVGDDARRSRFPRRRLSERSAAHGSPRRGRGFRSTAGQCAPLPIECWRWPAPTP